MKENLKRGGVFAQTVDGQMNEKNDNLLDDIERDIDSDWKKIQIKEQNKEHLKKFESKKRFYFPDFDEFYSTLLNIAHNDLNDPYIIEILKELLDRFFGSQMPKDMPISFKRIWEAMCNPYSNHSILVICIRCGNKFDILYRYKRMENERITFFDFISVNNIINHECDLMIVRCPTCGEVIVELYDCEFIGIIKI